MEPLLATPYPPLKLSFVEEFGHTLWQVSYRYN